MSQGIDDTWESLPKSSNNYVQPNATELLQMSYYQGDQELIPSAPPIIPARDPHRLMFGEDILKLPPPEWLPDSFAPNCGLCQQPFQAFVRQRHHCRMCGRIFCSQCCSKKLLLPPKFTEREPQRVCNECQNMLKPYQAYLAGCITNASRHQIHDVMDSSVIRSWVNLPVSWNLEYDIYKCTNIINQFMKANCFHSEAGASKSVLSDAQGFAIMSYVRVGVGWTCAMGTGLLIGRKNKDEWTPPCAIQSLKIGSGFQAGLEIVDLLIVIKNRKTLESFCGPVDFGIGGSASLAMGPLGRSSNASIQLGIGGARSCYTYSMSKGMFVGMSLEGSVVTPRNSTNYNFYGQNVSPKQLIFENVTSGPRACGNLYRHLDLLVGNTNQDRDTYLLQLPYYPQLPGGETLGVPSLRQGDEPSETQNRDGSKKAIYPQIIQDHLSIFSSNNEQSSPTSNSQSSIAQSNDKAEQQNFEIKEISSTQDQDLAGNQKQMKNLGLHLNQHQLIQLEQLQDGGAKNYDGIQEDSDVQILEGEVDKLKGSYKKNGLSYQSNEQAITNDDISVGNLFG